MSHRPMTAPSSGPSAGPPARPASGAGRGLRLRAALGAGRAASALSRWTGRGSGGVIGGRVVLKVQPQTPRLLSEGRRVMLVSGTNGKTTTTALLAAAMGTLGRVASNADGANTPPGFVAALADSTAERVVLETDEGWLPWTVAQAHPETALLLNLSRDQLTRHHEVGKLAVSWRSALCDVPTAVGNADDPDVVWAAMASPEQVWVAAGQWWTQDSVACPRCGNRCHRDGEHWECGGCGLARPEPDWWVEDDELVSTDVRLPLQLPLPGRFNKANAAMVVAAAAHEGADPQKVVEALRAVRTVAGRYAVEDYHGHRIRLLLAKNPAGWLETIELISQGDAPLVLAFNSQGVDGRDPSWLYDVSFRSLAGRKIVVIGERSADMGVRLKLDGLEYVDAGRRVRDALDLLPPGRVDVLANYTAFQDARRELAHARGQ